MTFFNDLFNEASNTSLASHTPDLGGTWVKHPNFAGMATVNAANDWAIGDSTSSALYYNDVAPPSADYSVSATIQINTTTTPNTGVMGRISSSASTMYMFYTSGSSWVLAKLVDGTNTDLLNVTATPTLNTDYTIELSMVGNTISAKVNGAHISGSPVTDSSISAAGFPGLRCRSGGSLKDITAVNLGAANATASGATLTGTSTLAPGSATGGEVIDGTAGGAMLTGTATLAAGAATGGSSGSFSFDPCENNTQSGVLDAVAVNWTWHTGLPGAVTAVTNGSGTLTSAGMTVSGLPAGAGYGVLRTADGTVVAYQEGTVT